ncbi:CO(2)-response secreted protease [Vigna angularis]|uniref:CO(2)-response secreted protease n=1 Tax=Phaseolus angularis TaxID=3914 RepID=A0A8T0KCX3_PHAAN|nr:CO(2)-response secreted protease [Vigna angularis]
MDPAQSLSEAKAATIHHYSKSFQGFSAMITPEQATQLAGIWPESQSFTDYGLGPVPKKFKGECVAGDKFTLANCNKKTIGARFYSKGFEAENGPLDGVVNKIFFRFCKNNTLNPTLIKGKIVICTIENFSDNRQDKAIEIRKGGGVGMILIDHNAKDVGFQFVIPSTLIAWSPVGTDATVEQRPVNYNIISGTSMSCPHITAVAAIIKSHHPSWGPAAIMSSIMTTATVTDNTQHLIRREPNGTQTTPFDYGSGHVNPVASLNPGLVYEFNSQDVLNFLCSNGASPAQVKNLTGDLTQCQKPLKASYNFNYPSIGVSNLNGSLSVYRTVTYYGQEPTVYSASIENPSGVKVIVTPAELKFWKTGEKITFRINIFPFKTSNGNFVFGSLTWNNGKQRVRSPIGVNVLST